MSERLAHVSYVLTPEEQAENMGSDPEFMISPLSEPLNIAIFVGGLLGVALLVYAGNKIGFIRERVRFFRGRARTYQDFIGLILRLSLGIALIGAASQQTIVSPAVPASAAVAVVELILGFLLIIGLALTPVTLATLGLGLGALIFNPELVDNLEFIGAGLALLLLGQAKPGVDDLLGISMYSWPEKIKAWVPTVLRFGLGLSLVIMAVADKLLNPHLFAAVVESYGLAGNLVMSPAMWVLSATIVELILGLGLIIGYRVRVVSLLTLLTLSISFFIFGEEVYAHVIIFASLCVLMITGAGNLSVDTKNRVATTSA